MYLSTEGYYEVGNSKKLTEFESQAQYLKDMGAKPLTWYEFQKTHPEVEPKKSSLAGASYGALLGMTAAIGGLIATITTGVFAPAEPLVFYTVALSGFVGGMVIGSQFNNTSYDKRAAKVDAYGEYLKSLETTALSRARSRQHETEYGNEPSRHAERYASTRTHEGFAR